MHKIPLLLLPLALAAAGCAPSLAPSQPGAGSPAPAAPGLARAEAAADGSYTLRVDATSSSAWTALDLDAQALVADGAPGWDLAFQRMNVKSNGGVSGSGGVKVARLAAPFDAVTAPPTEGFATDAADGPDEGTAPDYAFSTSDPWYDYNVNTHILTPKAVTYVVLSTEGKAFKLEFKKYYDDAGTSGYPTVRFAAL